jgi:hypothetical protein
MNSTENYFIALVLFISIGIVTGCIEEEIFEKYREKKKLKDLEARIEKDRLEQIEKEKKMQQELKLKADKLEKARLEKELKEYEELANQKIKLDNSNENKQNDSTVNDNKDKLNKN